MIEKNTSDFDTQPLIRFMDITNVNESIATLNEIITELKGLDLLIINSGVGMPSGSFEQEMNVIDVNVKGFTAVAKHGYNYFSQQGKGHLVGVSSVAGGRGMRISSAYAASKAYMSIYFEGLKHHARKYKTGVTITEIRPGFVDTPLTEGKSNLFWVAKPEKAARQIRNAIERKANIAYVTKRFFLVYWLLKLLPNWLFHKL